MTAAANAVPRWAIFVLAIIAIIVAFDNLGRPLANPDEGRYSEVSREMAQSGDWITPRLNGLKYFEKPPLQYWASALSFKLFGESERSARLYTALAGLLTLLIAGYTAARLFSPEHGVMTVLVLMASPYFMALGGVVTLDMGLTLWTTAAVCAFLVSRREADDSSSQRRWMIAAWVGMALAVLSKGLIGIVFPASTLFVYCASTGDFRLLRKLEWVRGPIAFLLVAAPWFVAVSVANPEFPEFFFIHEHFQRFLTSEHRRVEPWWYFLPIVFVGFLPWALALIPAGVAAWRAEAPSRGFEPLRFALTWSVVIVAFFSASGSKLPAYVLPVFPTLAIIIAHHLLTAPTAKLRWYVLPICVVAIVAAWAVWQAPLRARDEWTRAMYAAAQSRAALGVAVLLIGAVAGTWLLWRGKRWLGIIVVALATTVLIDCLEDAYENFAPRQSGRDVARKMLPLASSATPVYSVRIYDQTVPFYLGRTVTLVDYVDEFALGIKHEPHKVIPSVDDFVSRWKADQSPVAIMHPQIFEQLTLQGLPMNVVHQDPRRVVVKKP